MQLIGYSRGKWYRWFCSASFAMLIVAAAATTATAGDAAHCYPWCYCRTPMVCHPDDYCSKPLPCIPCPPCKWLCDDYCRKPLPCVPCPPCKWLCDDYCRKPMPCVEWPSLSKKCCTPEPCRGSEKPYVDGGR
jgi:hypothetical protein